MALVFLALGRQVSATRQPTCPVLLGHDVANFYAAASAADMPRFATTVGLTRHQRSFRYGDVRLDTTIHSAYFCYAN
ncbi:hypothetical protein F8280_19830 [Micromonospora noduli]|nr:hypothetical protein F8280_19830 [Micromonospora noduli]